MKYALLKLNILTVLKFDTRDELTDACSTLKSKDIQFIPLKLDDLSGQWSQMEQW